MASLLSADAEATPPYSRMLQTLAALAALDVVGPTGPDSWPAANPAMQRGDNEENFIFQDARRNKTEACSRSVEARNNPYRYLLTTYSQVSTRAWRFVYPLGYDGTTF